MPNLAITPSSLHRLTLNQHHYAVRHWGPATAPKLFLLHGWMDCSATFQFVVDALQQEWHIIAPDWRGFGHSAWNKDSYYFPDYLADLDALLNHYSPHEPVLLAGHSMGAMVAGLYAGIRPERIKRLILVEGVGLPDTRPIEAPGRYARWLREKQHSPAFSTPGSQQEVAEKLLSRAPLLRSEQALWLAGELTKLEENGQCIQRADPQHKMVNPVLYKLEEAKACWQRITAPTLWVLAAQSNDHPLGKAVASTLDERRQSFKHLTEITLEHTGHMVQWEQPVALARAIEQFFTA